MTATRTRTARARWSAAPTTAESTTRPPWRPPTAVPQVSAEKAKLHQSLLMKDSSVLLMNDDVSLQIIERDLWLWFFV